MLFTHALTALKVGNHVLIINVALINQGKSLNHLVTFEWLKPEVDV